MYNTILLLSHVQYDLTVDSLYDMILSVSFVQYQSPGATTTTTTSPRGVQIPNYLVIRTTDSLHQCAVVYKLYQ